MRIPSLKAVRSIAPGVLGPLYAAQFLLVAGLGLSFPFFTLYLHAERGMPMGLAGACLSLSMLGAALSHAVGGELSDLLGRRRVMLVSLGLRVFLIAALGEAVRRESPLGWLIALHGLQSLAGYLYPPAALNWLADRYGPLERARAYGGLRTVSNAGWALGPAVGGVFAGKSYAGLFFFGALLCAACWALVALSLRDEGPAPRRAQRFRLPAAFQFSSDALFLEFSLCAFLIYLVWSQMLATLSVHAVRYAALSEAQVGLLFSVNGLIVVSAQYACTRFFSRYRLSAAILCGSFLYAVGYAAFAFVAGFFAMALAMVLVSLGEISLAPALQAVSANMAPEALRGRYVGFNGFVHHLGFAAGPLLGGAGLQYLSPRWPPATWLAVSATALAAAAGFWLLRRRLSPAVEGVREATA